MINTYTFLKKA